MNLVLKLYYEDYESLLFIEDLDRVKFSLSDQYQHKYIALTLFKILSYKKFSKKTCFQTNQLIKKLLTTYNKY